MTEEEIVAMLTELGKRLARRGIQGEIYLVGGAAMALAYDAKHITKDIDAIFLPKDEIYREAREMADEFGLSKSWLNNSVKEFFAEGDKKKVSVLEVPGLRVAVASPEYMLTVKCLAARLEDEEDIKSLLELLGVRTVNEALEIVKAVYPEWVITPRTRFLLEKIFSENILLGNATKLKSSPRTKSKR